MRDDYAKFQELGAHIVVVVQSSQERVRSYFTLHKLPYSGIGDEKSELAQLYGQEWKLLKLGQMPAQFVVDRAQQLQLAHYGKGMSDIVHDAEILPLLRNLRDKQAPRR